MKQTMIRKMATVCIILLLILSISPPVMANYPDGGEFRAGTGDTLIHIEIMPTVYDYMTEYTVYTKESNLIDAMLGANLIQGEYVSWGFNITAVDGREVDYGEGGYWHIYHDMLLETGRNAIPIEEDGHFFLTLSAFWDEDEDGNALLAANDADLPWPENWPVDIPKMDGRIVAYFGGDTPDSPLGMGLGLALTGFEAMQAYVDHAALLGYRAEERESDNHFFLTILTGRGYQITLSQDVECTIHVRKQPLSELGD